VTDREALLRAIAARLNQDAPREIYAEWLQENAWAENSFADQAKFIRIQLMQDHGFYRDEYGNPLPSTPDVVAKFEAEADELLRLHRGEWEAPIREALGGRCEKITFHRGFPATLEVGYSVQPLIDSGILESDYNTLTGLKLKGVREGDVLQSLLSYQGLLNISSLDFESSGIAGTHNYIRNAAAEALADSPFVANLTSLNLYLNDTRDADVRAIANSPNLAKLESLNLGFNPIGNAGIIALRDSRYLKKITALNIGCWDITEEGLRILADPASVNFANLTSLDVGNCSIGNSGVRILANSPNLAKLTSLSLHGGHSGESVGDQAMQFIARSRYLKNLTKLDLCRNDIGDAGATAIANSPNFAHLTNLDFMENRIGNAGGIALARSKFLTNLIGLNLSYNQIGDEGGIALANSPNLTHLTTLNLGGYRFGDKAAVAIAKSPYLSQSTKRWCLNWSGAGYGHILDQVEREAKKRQQGGRNE
jgi:uncharacterized protein (TIGR02996 family)